MKKVRVLYIDLDGTVRKGFNELGKFVNKKEDVEVFEGVPDKLSAYQSAGWRIVGVTNQGGLALGHMSWDELEANISETNRQCRYIFERIMVCQHHPDAPAPEYALCWCRKPKIGNIVIAASALAEKYGGECYPPHLSLFVGDRPEDEQCADNAGIPFMDAKEWRDAPASDLLDSMTE